MLYADLYEELSKTYVNDVYNTECLTQILTDKAGIIGANILNIAHQDWSY